MRYMLELSNMHGDGLADDPLNRFESDTPITLPATGDRIIVSGAEYIVASRLFTFYEFKEKGKGHVMQHVQVFCRDRAEEQKK
jgi:hypothetical protein